MFNSLFTIFPVMQSQINNLEVIKYSVSKRNVKDHSIITLTIDLWTYSLVLWICKV